MKTSFSPHTQYILVNEDGIPLINGDLYIPELNIAPYIIIQELDELYNVPPMGYIRAWHMNFSLKYSYNDEEINVFVPTADGVYISLDEGCTFMLIEPDALVKVIE